MSRKSSKKRRKAGPGRWIAAIIALLLLFLTAVGMLNANTVYLRRATVFLADLPPAFEGTSLLYLTDIDLCGINTPEKSAALVNRLQALKPDILLLGGDYTSPSLWTLLNRGEGDDAWPRRRDAAAAAFFQGISGFQAPMGRYALTAPEDGDMTAILTGSGFTPITNAAVTLNRGGDAVRLLGLGGDSGATNLLMDGRAGGECVIVAAISPASFPLLLTLEAPGGGPLVDLALAGHTHGGQIRLLGRNVISLTSQERQYLHGWNREGTVPLLTTSGVGCEGVNLRFGSAPEAWLITLTGSRDDG